MTIKIAKKIVKFNVQKPDDKPAEAKPAPIVDPDVFQDKNGRTAKVIRMHEKVERPVDSRPRDLLVFRAQPHEKLVRLEMLVAREELVEEGLTLGCQLESPLLEVLAEDRLFAVVHRFR